MPFVPAVVQPAVLSDCPLWFVVQGNGIVLRTDGNADGGEPRLLPSRTFADREE